MSNFEACVSAVVGAAPIRSTARMPAAFLAWSIVIVAALGVGCGEKREAPGSSKPAAALETVDKTWDFEALKVVGKVPKGWSESQLGPGFTYGKPGSPMGTYLWVTPTCQGTCGKIAENLKQAAAEDIRTQKLAGYEAKVVADSEIPNGRVHELVLTNGGETILSFTQLFFASGWQEALSCRVTATPEDRGLYDDLTALCRGLTASPK